MIVYIFIKKIKKSGNSDTGQKLKLYENLEVEVSCIVSAENKIPYGFRNAETNIAMFKKL